METTPAPTPPAKSIAFLGYREFENGDAIRGGLLVTDEWGKPLEFRCTAPVRPTQLQRTLYGKSLLPHILSELVGVPLIGALREQPKLILLSVDGFLEVRLKVSVPVFVMAKADSLPNFVMAKADSLTKPDDKVLKTLLLESASGKFAPVVATPHWKFPADVGPAAELLRELSGQLDLTEPFLRLCEGLKFVHDERVLDT